MDVQELRSEIDQIDEQLVELFCKRMRVAESIAHCKKSSHIPIHVPDREQEKLMAVSRQAGPQLSNYTRVLYSVLFELSRSYQGKLTMEYTELYNRIQQSMAATPQLFPQQAAVACQGAEGAYAQIACEKIFKSPYIVYFKNMESIFSAIEQGLCQYGILPLENSAASSLKKIYDLMIRHKFSIVRSFHMQVEHNLLALPDANLRDIREIYSHEQAFYQCGEFLSTLPGVKVIPVENTAAAAKMVALSGRKDVAALSSRSCEELYGLKNLARSVQDKGSNRTRFICISKNLEIYPGADRTSIMMVLPHKPGALYKVLARLYVLGINVTKLESRPIPENDLDFRFYFDLETSVYSEEFVQLMCELDDLCEEFEYLGSYTEVV